MKYLIFICFIWFWQFYESQIITKYDIKNLTTIDANDFKLKKIDSVYFDYFFDTISINTARRIVVYFENDFFFYEDEMVIPIGNMKFKTKCYNDTTWFVNSGNQNKIQGVVGAVYNPFKRECIEYSNSLPILEVVEFENGVIEELRREFLNQFVRKVIEKRYDKNTTYMTRIIKIHYFSNGIEL